jgi:hypothetical protein
MGERSRPVPVLTLITLGLTAIGTATRLFGTGVEYALRRDPSKLAHGQVWRLLTPVLVQTDHSVLAVLVVFGLCAVIGAAGERAFSRPLWLALYLLGALVGHGIGEVFQPHQGGASVAFFGILGGLLARVLLGRPPAALPPRIAAGLAVPVAILDTALRDIHGLPLLAGFGLAAIWELRSGQGRTPRR